MKTLALDSSSQVLSVALLDGEKLVADYCLTLQKNHSTSLMPTVDFLVKQAGWKPTDLERIVVAQGPGSYTGLRVAVATAKTLAYALNIDLVGVSSLYALVPGVEGLIVPLIDARRNTVYAGFYENGRAIKPDCNADFTDVLDSLAGQDKLTFVGETTNFADQIAAYSPRAVIRPTLPSAYRIGLAGLTAHPLEPHEFVPTYLKRVEAEENWLKTAENTGNSDYIKRI